MPLNNWCGNYTPMAHIFLGILSRYHDFILFEHISILLSVEAVISHDVGYWAKAFISLKISAYVYSTTVAYNQNIPNFPHYKYVKQPFLQDVVSSLLPRPFTSQTNKN